MDSSPLLPSASFRVYQADGFPGRVYFANTTVILSLACQACPERVAEPEQEAQCELELNWGGGKEVGDFGRRPEEKSLESVNDMGGVAEDHGETQATL